jgi:hypothetical protein
VKDPFGRLVELIEQGYRSADNKEARFKEAAHMTTEQKVQHPDIEWCKQVVRSNKGDRVTTEELDTIWWNGLMGCYLMQWAGMTLGIETDGHIHS